MTVSRDLLFSIEVDLVKMTDFKDRLLIEGFLGELNSIEFSKGQLIVTGEVGTLSIQLTENM
jgi:hypothetical protein